MIMKRYIKPTVQVLLNDDIIVTSGESTITGTVGNPTNNPGDIGAPGRKTIWN